MINIKKFEKVFIGIFFLMLPILVHAEDINDAFVLVDVSGSMTDSKTNSEAKNIIQEILVGDFSTSKWQNYGWKLDASVNKLPSSTIMKSGSKFYIIPFGQMQTVRSWSGHIYKDAQDFVAFYSGKFPTTFKDAWTYLTLAKAYVGAIALTDNVRSAYMIIYSDGKPQSTNDPLNKMDQSYVDALEAAGSNALKKNAILRKKMGGDNHFDIEVWEFVNYKGYDIRGKEIDPDTIKIAPPSAVSPHIRITQPKDGQNIKNTHSLNTKEELKIVWEGGLASAIVVQKKAGNSWSRIPDAKEVYELKEQGTSAIITFFESADYKITVRGNEGGSDDLYVNVSTSILSFLLPLLIIILLVLGGVYLYNYFRPPIVDPGNPWEEENKKSGNNSSGKNDDDW